MPSPKKKSITNSNAIEKTIVASVASLTSACNQSAIAVDSLSKVAKTLAKESLRLNKKRSLLMKRKKTVAAKQKKSPNSENKKAIQSVEKELSAISKEIAKVKPQKDSNAVELKTLKSWLKRASAYTKGIESADKVLNKPKKKIRRKVAKKRKLDS